MQKNITNRSFTLRWALCLTTVSATGIASADITSMVAGGWLRCTTDGEGGNDPGYSDISESTHSLTFGSTAAYSSSIAHFSQALSPTRYVQNVDESASGNHHFFYGPDIFGNLVLQDNGGGAAGWGEAVARLEITPGYYYFHDSYSSHSAYPLNSASVGYYPNAPLFSATGVTIIGPTAFETNQLGTVDWQGFLPGGTVYINTEVSSNGYGSTGSANSLYFGMQPVPEPSSIAVLGLGVLPLLRRRKS